MKKIFLTFLTANLFLLSGAIAMSTEIEIERKFAINNPQIIENFISDSSFIKEKRDVDVYYDTIDGNLFKKGIFLRVRNNKKMEFKLNLNDFLNEQGGDHSSCTEFSFDLPFSLDRRDSINEVLALLGLEQIQEISFDSLLETNKLNVFVTINKNRLTYKTTDGFTLCVDNVQDLGSFVEIEQLATSQDQVDDILKQIDQKFGIPLGSEHLPIGYVELYLRKNNFGMYKAGKYKLDIDLL